MTNGPEIRQARDDDTPAISAMLTELAAAGLRSAPADEQFVQDHCVASPHRVSCAVAEIDGEIVGLQLLSKAWEGNFYDVTPGWGVIGTHNSPRAHRRGIGRALFYVTRSRAEAAGLPHPDATTGAGNPMGLGYYDAMGFVDYRVDDETVSKRFEVGWRDSRS